MKTKVFLTVIFFHFAMQIWGQTYSIGFDKDTIRVERKIDDSLIIPIKIKTNISDKTDWRDYSLSVEPNYKSTNFSTSEFQVDFERIDFNKLKESFVVYLFIKKESEKNKQDGEREIILHIKIEAKGKEGIGKQNMGANQKLVVLVKPSQKTLREYKYLSYIGTNFDLVEGIKAENLFFATNILSQPTHQKDFGFYLSLYGNRTISTKEEFEQEINTEIVPISENKSYRLNKRVKTTRTRNSDNLGAHFSTLHPIFGTRYNNHEMKSYFTLSADFIWKRTHILTEYGDITRIDTLSTASVGQHIILNPLQREKKSFNQYSFNIGPGLFFVVENENISVRVQGAVGYTTNFILDSEKINDDIVSKRENDIFFMGRAWITEPKTGITLQAEISNRFINPKPSYVVTLSKAFQLDRLGGFFSPITQR